MNLTWVDQITIGFGLATMVLYVIRSFYLGHKPRLPVAVTCVASGGSLFFGGVLVCTPFVSSLQKMPIQPIHLVIAGLATSWVGIAFLWELWTRPQSAGSIPTDSRGAIEQPSQAPMVAPLVLTPDEGKGRQEGDA